MTGGPDPVCSLQDMAGLATPMAIRVAATLGLADRAGSGATAERLAADTGTAAPVLRRLLDHLVTVGVFAYDEERYRPTALGEQLRADDPDGVRLLLDVGCAGGRAELAFVELLHTVTTGEPAYPRRYGRDFWADLDARPELRRSSDLQMNRRFRVQAAQIAGRYDWGRFPEVLDVGGGDGTVLAAILAAHPGVRGRVLELPPTAEAAAERFAAAGLEARPASSPAASSTPCRTGRTPTCCRTSCTTGTTPTPPRSSLGAPEPRVRAGPSSSSSRCSARAWTPPWTCSC